MSTIPYYISIAVAISSILTIILGSGIAGEPKTRLKIGKYGIFVIFLALIMNVISYYQKSKIDLERFEKLSNSNIELKKDNEELKSKIESIEKKCKNNAYIINSNLASYYEKLKIKLGAIVSQLKIDTRINAETLKNLEKIYQNISHQDFNKYIQKQNSINQHKISEKKRNRVDLENREYPSDTVPHLTKTPDTTSSNKPKNDKPTTPIQPPISTEHSESQHPNSEPKQQSVPTDPTSNPSSSRFSAPTIFKIE